MNILEVTSSIRGDQSVSRLLVRETVERLSQGRQASITQRNLDTTPLGHLTNSFFEARARWTSGAECESVHQNEIAQGEALIEEFVRCDAVVIGAPIYNFGLSTQLKAWLDRLAVAGRTFRYGPDGPIGIAERTTVYVIVTSGSRCTPEDDPRNPPVASQLRPFFKLLGVKELHFVVADGLNTSPESRESALERARAQIDHLTEVALQD